MSIATIIDPCWQSESSQSHCPKLPFHLYFNHSSDDSGNLHGTNDRDGNLPSALLEKLNSISSTGQVVYQGGSKIFYRLEVSVVSQGRMHKQVSQDVQIFGCVDTIPPPIYIQDYPGEYTCKQIKSLFRLLSVSGYSLTACIAEPSPLSSILSEDIRPAMFTLRMFLTSQRGKSLLLPPSFELCVSWTLKTHTYWSVLERQVAPTSQEARTSPFTKEKARLGGTRNYKLLLSEWRASPGTTTTRSTNVALRLPVIEQGFFPIPSFFSQYVTRRYSVTLHLDVSSGHYGRASFDLVVPLQIVYVGSDPPEPVCDEAESTPAYIP